ncbi:hypothetical protein ACSBR2_023159 [Camellia fascicularis]
MATTYTTSNIDNVNERLHHVPPSNIDNVNERLHHVPRTKCIEEPFYMIDRDSGVGQVDRLSSLYDLADFEMQRTSSVDGTEDVLVDVRPLSHVNTMPQSQAEAEIEDKLPVTEEVVSQTTLSDVPNLPILEKNKEFQMMDNVSNQDYGNGNTSGRERRSKTRYSSNKDLISQKDTSLMERCQSMQQKFAGVSKFCEFPASVQTWNCQSGKYPEIKECDRSSSPSMKDNDHVYKVVKTEPVDATSTLSVKIPFLAVTGRLSFLELPSCLPLVTFRGRPIMERKYLDCGQSSTMRNRVSKFCQVVGKHFARQIAFRLEMNVLLKLRMCRSAFMKLEIEDVSECIYEVSVDRKIMYHIFTFSQVFQELPEYFISLLSVRLSLGRQFSLGNLAGCDTRLKNENFLYANRVYVALPSTNHKYMWPLLFPKHHYINVMDPIVKANNNNISYWYPINIIFGSHEVLNKLYKMNDSDYKN